MSTARTVMADRWLTCPRPNPAAQVRLFCLPYAGGAAHIFRNWHVGLPGEVEVHLVHLPGRAMRMMEPPFTRIADLVDDLAPAVQSKLNKPYAVFGHSMGALIGFELVHVLRKQTGLEAAHLFASGCSAPHIPDPNPIHMLPDGEFIDALRALNGIPQEILQHEELFELILPTLRADMLMTEKYEPLVRDPLRCPITVFGGLEDPIIYREHLEQWQQHTSGEFLLQIFPGDHFFCHTEEARLLTAVSRQLEKLMSMTHVRLSL
jgi:surfactin synthase thioesterase subunit